ncbi:MAG: hypothetical protein LBG04_02195 [Holosporaceae bacterium]|nr:hypothetical protein [Holosporaceae bacterium]
MKVEEFCEIVEKVRPEWDKLQKQKKVSGRNSHLKTLEDEILLVLIFYRFYVSHEFLERLILIIQIPAFAQNGAAFGEKSNRQKRQKIIGRRFAENNG